MAHTCIRKLIIIGPDSGLSPCRRQAINRNNAGLMLIVILKTNLSEISIETHIFSYKKIKLKMSSA